MSAAKRKLPDPVALLAPMAIGIGITFEMLGREEPAVVLGSWEYNFLYVTWVAMIGCGATYMARRRRDDIMHESKNKIAMWSLVGITALSTFSMIAMLLFRFSPNLPLAVGLAAVILLALSSRVERGQPE